VRVRYTRPAAADLASILEYIAAASPQGAQRVQRRIQHVVELLLTHPNIGVLTVDPSIRRLTTTPYPFLVFYEVSGDEVIVHAIRHSARDPSGMPGSE
jgi:toxin ParE1/3/4